MVPGKSLPHFNADALNCLVDKGGQTERGLLHIPRKLAHASSKAKQYCRKC